jgi:signal transduction histidine kinase
MLKLGLRTRFFLYSNTLIVVTMTLVTILAIVHERRSRYGAIERRGRSICEAMAIPIADVLAEEALGRIGKTERVESYLLEIQERNRDLMRYVVVTDPGGRVTHASDRDLLGEPFGRALDHDAVDSPSPATSPARLGDERVLEMRAPLDVAAGAVGSLIVGFSAESIEQQVRSIALRAVLVALPLMIGNSALTAVYVETLIRPILGLHKTMRRAARGDFSVRARSRVSAEVGELANAFNRMMDEVEEARDREKARQAQLAHTEKMAAVGTLAAGVAHEVNNPLGGILTCIENVRTNLEDREMLERYLELIHDGLKRIEHTVANLLDFSRERKMELAPTSINHSVQHVLELAKYQLRQGRIDVHSELDPAEPFVMADQFQVDQLFLNLVLNALQAMPDGGRLTLRTLQKKGMVLAEVHDTGVGISAEMRERIFDPFFTTREVGEGTGLGLTVSDSIATSHGGTMEVESTPGKGSVFRVSFPMLSPRTGGGGLGEGSGTASADR